MKLHIKREFMKNEEETGHYHIFIIYPVRVFFSDDVNKEERDFMGILLHTHTHRERERERERERVRTISCYPVMSHLANSS